VLLTAAPALKGNGAGDRSTLIVVDSRSGKAYRVPSIMSDTPVRMLSGYIGPMADELGGQEPALVFFQNWSGRSINDSHVGFLGDSIDVGEHFASCFRRRRLRFHATSCDWTVESCDSVDGFHRRVVHAKLKGKGPKMKHGSILVRQSTLPDRSTQRV
jgi:hypothetical protein